MLLGILFAIFGLLPMLGGTGSIVFTGGELPLVVALCAPTLFVVLRYLRAGSQAEAPAALRPAELPFRRFPELP
jgi:hypothetical protein